MRTYLLLITSIALGTISSLRAQHTGAQTTEQPSTVILENRLGVKEVRNGYSELLLEVQTDLRQPSVQRLRSEFENLDIHLTYSVKDLQAVQREVERKALKPTRQ